mmetsp:Transcript_10701/g.14399  ORF Transcript_10701/g.14399 Transcript_10701/m.14399 type:complete len:213 (+) Transcript_10701:243-881(+)
MEQLAVDPVCLDLLERYLAKLVYQNRGLVATLFCTSRLTCKQHAVRQVLAELGPCIGFIVTGGFHSLILGTILVLNVRQDEALNTGDSSFLKTISDHSILVFALGGFALLMTCLAWGLLLKPGILAKVNLVQSGNIVTKLCHEMDAPVPDDDLTPLDSLCLVCLNDKYVHLEHCKACNKCIRHFHLHSNFFNKCFGDANIRPYLLFYLMSLG